MQRPSPKHLQIKFNNTLKRQFSQIECNYSFLKHPCYLLAFVSLMMTAILTGVKWNLNINLYSYNTNSMWLKVFIIFLYAYWALTCLTLKSFQFIHPYFGWFIWGFFGDFFFFLAFYNLDIISVRFFFSQLSLNSVLSFIMHKPFNLIQFHLSFLSLSSWAFEGLFRKSLPSPLSWSVLLCFSV